MGVDLFIYIYIYIYSETCHSDHLYRPTTSLYALAFLVTEIKSAVCFQCCGKFYKSTTSVNGLDEFTLVSGRLRGFTVCVCVYVCVCVCVYIYIYIYISNHTHIHTHIHADTQQCLVPMTT